jgi:hypothetical protein
METHFRAIQTIVTKGRGLVARIQSHPMNEERCGLLQDDELKVDGENPTTTGVSRCSQITPFTWTVSLVSYHPVPSLTGTDRRFWMPSHT